MRRLPGILVSCASLLLASSCGTDRYDIFDPEKPDLIDPALHLDRNDYKTVNDISGSSNTGAAPASEPPLPDLAEILAAPKPPKLGQTQLVSVAVTDDVPVKDVLIELARLADVDVEIDAGVTGGINFRAKDRPFNEVVDRIADLAGLRYTMKDNVLHIERDTPYVQIYPLDFLNLQRDAQSSVNISTSVLASTANGSSGGSGASGSSGGSSGGSGGGSSSTSSTGGALSNGSTSTVTYTATSDFWRQFEETVKRVLQYKEPKHVSTTSVASQPGAPGSAAPAEDVKPEVSPQPPLAGAVAAAIDPNCGAAAAGTTATSSSSSSASTPGSTNFGPGSGVGCNGSFYILSREASTLTVSAPSKQQAMIAEFIRRVREKLSAQVLIEAKIVEVTLDNQFQSGINWSKLGNDKVSFTGVFGPTTNGGIADAANVATFSVAPGNDLNNIVKLAEAFGTTRTLASPRLHAMNNQQAVLTFAQNHVYFTVLFTPPTSTTTGGVTTGSTAATITSTPHTIPIGIILSMQPSIDTENSEVTLSIHPTLSRIVDEVNDPAVAISVAQDLPALIAAGASESDVAAFKAINSQFPVVEVRELDSILKLKSGQVMVIGGLMEDASTNTEAGIPGATSIPFFGNLFKGINRDAKTSELVIFIRATIVGDTGDSDKADRRFYQKFTKDPRPLEF